MRVNGNETVSSKQTGRLTQPQDAKKAEKTEKAEKVEKTDKADRASTSEADKKTHSSATTEISTKSKEMARAKSAATDAPDVRESKVADIKSRIESGNYHIDADAIADRMVDEHLAFPGAIHE